MQNATGNLGCQAAAFIYKEDDTALRAWSDVQQISHIRREVHTNRSSFLTSLRAWNNQPQLDPTNAFLSVYAHMGPPGISPKGSGDPSFDPANIISWADLASALPRGVDTCWLVGCTSKAVTSVWHPTAGPVRGRLMVTEETASWLPLVKFFVIEIGMDPITYPEEMLKKLVKLLPTLGQDIAYYESESGRWELSFPLP